jgi:iron complex outermembrane receptor protein
MNVNPSHKVVSENIDQYILNSSIGKEISFPLSKKIDKMAAADVFLFFKEQKVVTASKKLQKITDAPSIISVHTRQDIEMMGVTSLIDVLKFVPGIETSMGPDGHYRLAIRGARKNGIVLVLINGHRFNDFYNGMPLYDIPVGCIERIEVVRGPGSALYGTNAVAGVINIFTVKNEKSILASGGTNSYYQGNVNYSIGEEEDNYKFSISGGYKSTEGANAFIRKDTGSIGSSLFNSTVEKWDLTYGEKKSKTNRFLKDGYFQTWINYDSFHLNAFGIFRNQGSWISPIYYAVRNSDFKNNQILWDAYYEYQLSKTLIITPKIYSDLVIHDYLIQFEPENSQAKVGGDVFRDGKLAKEKYTGLNLGSDIQINYYLNRKFDIITGLVYENISMIDYDLTRNYKIVGEEYKEEFGNYDNVSFDQKNKTRDIWAYYLQGDFTWEILNILSGIRYDHYSDFGQSFNPRAGLVVKPIRELTLKALYGQAFRAPTFQELYDNTSPKMDYSGIEGNLDLEPETVRTSELGIEIILWKFILRGNGFYNQNYNLIGIYDPNGNGGIGTYENIGDTESFGGETELVVFIIKTLKLFINYSYVKTYFFNNPDLELYENSKKYDWYDNEVRNMPTVRINGGFSFSYSNFIGYMGMNYGNASENNSRTFLEREAKTKIPYFMQLNFSLAYSFHKNFVIKVAGNNIKISGTKYSDPEESNYIFVMGGKGMAQPGETYIFSLIYRFD